MPYSPEWISTIKRTLAPLAVIGCLLGCCEPEAVEVHPPVSVASVAASSFAPSMVDAGSAHGSLKVRRLPFKDPERTVEVNRTLDLIEQGGPFPFRQDGSVFQNRERKLPSAARDCYHEYTVRTPGAQNRGARRIVTGCREDTWYTDDHYRTFQEIDARRYER